MLSLKHTAVPAEGGEVLIDPCYLDILTPLPSSWIMLKSGDFLVSRSGTIRMLLRKVWEAGKAECVRLKCDTQDGQISASLDLERMELNSSNFENLFLVVRDASLEPPASALITHAHLTKHVRFNILSLLGFGSIGSKLHVLIPSIGSHSAQSIVTVALLADAASGQFIHIATPLHAGEAQPALSYKKPLLEIAVSWMRDDEKGIFRISHFAYPPGSPALLIESVTLASEFANRISIVSSLIGEYNRTIARINS
ncbi:MAG: hypothetical protein J5J00_14115 [Deltaproteobacteria bacterium]|nr:hypothetical protein [Deltaproteobacteria bacterium]